MRAIVCHNWGEPETLSVEDLTIPTPSPGQVRIAVHGAGLNFADVLLINGRYQERPERPFVPGWELSGVVDVCGAEVERWRPGDRVAAQVDHGAFAEFTLADQNRMFAIPAAMPFEAAAGFVIPYGTAYGALVWRGGLRTGETLLVLGGAGGVGLATIEVGKAIGADVIGAAGGEFQSRLMAEHGADATVDYAREDLRDRVKSLTDGRGADVIVDLVGGDPGRTALRCVGWEARIIVVGFASGDIPDYPANIVLVKNIGVLGLVWGPYQRRDPAAVAQAYDKLFAWYEAGRLRPAIKHMFALPEVPKALARLRDRNIKGKAIMTLAI